MQSDVAVISLCLSSSSYYRAVLFFLWCLCVCQYGNRNCTRPDVSLRPDSIQVVHSKTTIDLDLLRFKPCTSLGLILALILCRVFQNIYDHGSKFFSMIAKLVFSISANYLCPSAGWPNAMRTSMKRGGWSRGHGTLVCYCIVECISQILSVQFDRQEPTKPSNLPC